MQASNAWPGGSQKGSRHVTSFRKHRTGCPRVCGSVRAGALGQAMKPLPAPPPSSSLAQPPSTSPSRCTTPSAGSASPRCQEVLDDFTDAEGRPFPLRESLGTSTPEAYLKRLVIRDGEVPSGHCASRDTAAFHDERSHRFRLRDDLPYAAPWRPRERPHTRDAAHARPAGEPP